MPSTSNSEQRPHQPRLDDELLPEGNIATAAGAATGRPILAALALILVALNLRPALSSLAPVLPEVMQTLGISAATASVLTMAPVLCLGVFGFIAPRLTERFGPERVIVGALLLLAAGTALRGISTFSSLLAGTLLAGAAIGVAGVLLPSLVKRDFSQQASLMTGVYTMALCTGAATAAGLTVPLARALEGWPTALAFWALPALAVALIWLPQARAPHGGRGPAARQRVTGLWRDALAWQVTLFMGLQSSLAYIVFGWLAPILRERGLDPAIAGFAVSISIIVQLVTALTAPIMAGRRPSQSGAVAVFILVTMLGLLGCLYAPPWTLWLWIIVLGLGQGGNFALALSLIVLRAPNPQVATQLSSMAQSIGYTLAAGGPLLAGLLHGWTGSWAATGGLFAAICLLALGFGMGAGRPLYVTASSRPV